MSYEIPQELRYREKILFNFDFEQVIYLILFGLLAFISFKSEISFNFKIIVLVLSLFSFIGFAYFNLKNKLIDFISWFFHRNIYFQSKEEIAIEVSSINFSIKNNESKSLIIKSFQRFLNSLDFPIQIFIKTEKLNLDNYLDRINLDNDLFQDYKNHLLNSSKENSGNKRFYIVLKKENSDYKQKLVINGLKELGLECRVVSLPGKIYELENNIDFIKENKYFRIIYASGYPRFVEPGFIDSLLSISGDFDLSIHIKPWDIEETMILLNKELIKQKSDLYSASLKNSVNPSLEIKYEDTNLVLRDLQKGRDKLFDLGLYILCRADSLEELDLLTKRIESKLNSLVIVPKIPRFRMFEALKTCLPLAEDCLKFKRNITTSGLSAFFPFTSSFYSDDSNGIWFGMNKNNIPIIKDIFSFSNPNGLCLASSGAGKSYMTKLMISRHLLNNTKVMIIDPQGEYREIVRKFDGELIDLSRTSKTIINPLDLMGESYHEKRLSLMSLMPIMLGELSEPQKTFIDKAITEAYERKGINFDPSTWSNQPPKMENVLEALIYMERRGLMIEKAIIRSLINRVSMYVSGVFSFMNNHTKINFDNNLVCFDIGNLPKQIKPVMMFLVLNYIYTKMRKDLDRKLLVIDESWALLNNSDEASYIFEIVKTCRKFNLALFLINQEVEGMLDSSAGKSVLANSSYTILMRQKPSVIKQMSEIFSLSEYERDFLVSVGVGEGLLISENEHSEIRFIASDKEHELITTKPDEIIKIDKIRKSKNIEISLDLDIPYYKVRNLKKEEINYLISKGYVKFRAKNLNGKVMDHLLMPWENESLEHCFLLHEINDYLKKLKIKTEVYNAVNPDIIFYFKGKRYAIEVETGKGLRNKDKFLNKVKSLKKDFGNNYFFVLTNKDFKKIYVKYGKTLDVDNFDKYFRKRFMS